MTFTITSPLAALEFLSFPMLGWLVAAALPWLIHRWQRSQHQTTPWAAVELLLNAMQQQAKRVQLQQWLLLAIRTTILLLVIFAAAEPTLRQWAGTGSTQEHLHRIIVVDQSYSMGCKQSGTTRWHRALSRAGQWIEGSDGNAITIIAWAEQTDNLLGRPTFDKSIALAALDDLQLTQTSAELPSVSASNHSSNRPSRRRNAAKSTHIKSYSVPTWGARHGRPTKGNVHCSNRWPSGHR